MLPNGEFTSPRNKLDNPILFNQNILALLNQNSPTFNQNNNSALWNSMIFPYLRMRIAGAIWYQGESNVGQDEYYACEFPAMISDWREKFGLGDSLAFHFVQLAAYTEGGSYGLTIAELRAAQLAALKLPNVGFATAADLGDLNSPFGNIHPRNKQTVGWRLSQVALSMDYDVRGLHYLSPQAINATVTQGPPNVTVQVSFSPIGRTNGALEFHEGVTCPSQVEQTNECGWYAIVTSDNQWHNATATLNGNLLMLSVQGVSSSLKVSGAAYGFADWPVCNLYNSFDWPVIPFYFPIK